MASKDTTDAVSVPQPEPGSTVATQLAQIEQPPEPSAYDAFAQAAQQETDPTYQAFKNAAQTKIGQMQLPGEGILPWQIGSRFAPSFWQHALETTEQMAVGTERAIANLFDPKALYSKQTDAQLQNGIATSQARIDQLNKDAADSADEYSFANNLWERSSLQNDINAMQKQLSDRQGQARVPDPWERAGEAIRGDIAETEQWMQQEQARRPLNPVFEAGPAGRVAQLAGGVAPYIPLGELGAIPEMVLGAGQAYESTWQEGEHMGVDPTVTNRAGLWSSAFMPAQIGAFRTALAPFMSGMVGRTVRELLTDAAKNAATGAAVGGAQTMWNNVVASTSGLDPNRKITDGLAQSIVEQSATMTALGLVTQAPSFALRAVSNPRIDAYKASGAPEVRGGVQAPEAAAPAPGGVPGETEEALQERLRSETLEGLARRDVTAPQPPPGGVPQPLARGDIQGALSELRDRVGPRADFLLADERSLPLRYNKALAEQGLNRNNFKAFFDRDTNDLIVNPKNITSAAELNDIVNRNFIPNTFRGLANIVPVDSWHQVAENPSVATLLARDPHADTTTGGLYDRQSGTVFTNVSKINSSADPIAEGLSTAVHEISVHQGLRSQFGQDYPAFVRFLQRVWNGFQQTGTGDQVATAAGARNIDELARAYGLGTEQPDGTLTLSPREQGRLAEELLARYSERFDPAQLDKAPGVLQRAIGLVKDGLARFQGLHFTDDQAFRFIRDSWRGTEPPRSPEVNSGLLARRIIKTDEQTELERTRANDQPTRDIAAALGSLAASGGREPLTELPAIARPGDVAASGGREPLAELPAIARPGDVAAGNDRIGAYAASTGRSIPASRFNELTSLKLPRRPGAEHDVYTSSDPNADYLIKATRSGGDHGPWGGTLHEATPESGLAPTIGEKRAIGPATPEHYLERLALSNEIFGTGNHLEGFTREPGAANWSIVSTQPRIDNARPSTNLEIANYMASKGFHPLNDRDYYDPERMVATLDAHPGNVLTEQATGRVHPVDVIPTHVDPESAREFQRIIEDPRRIDALQDHLNLDALHNQLAGKGIDLEAPRPPAAQMRMEDHFARDENELADLRAKNAREGLKPEEQQRMDDIEFGPLMKRDLELELGPEADPNEPAHRLLQRALETILTADPSQGVRVPALRTVLNDRDFYTVREFNTAVSQLLYEKGGRAFWDRITGDVYRAMGGDTERIMNAVMANLYPREINAQLYKHLWNDLADLRQEAIGRGDLAKKTAIESARNSLDSWANEARTQWGKEGAAWQDVYFSAQGIMGKVRSDYDKEVHKQLQKVPGFADAVEHLRLTRDEITKSAPQDPGVKQMFEAAQRQHNFRLPAEYAKAISEELSNRFGGALAKPEDKAALDQVFNRFKQTIAQKIKEQGAAMPMPDTKKMSASQRVIDALSNWHWFEDAWNQTINELKNAPDANPLFFAKVKDALDAPFSGSELQRVMREQDINIGDLFKQHRSRIGTTIDSLSDFLSKRSNLTPEQSALVQRGVQGHIESQVRARIQQEFQRIIDKAQQGGRTVSARARADSLERLRTLINMGAFAEKDVANALAPMYGYAGFTPEMSSRLTQLNDSLEKTRNDGRNGFQTEGIRQELLRTLAEYAKGQKGRYWLGIFTGNLMSGGPTHVGAFASEFMQGMLNLATNLPWRDRPELVVPSFLESIKALGKGMGQAITDHSQYIWATGKDPALFRTEESLNDEQSKMYTPNIFETAPTQRALARLGPAAAIGKLIDVPYRQLFRSVSLLHNLIYSGFGRSTEMLAALRFARERGMSFEEGRDWANDMMNADQGRREAYRQAAAAEGLTGATARMRVQEMIDQGVGRVEDPEEVEGRKAMLSRADFSGTRANFMQDPEGLLGLASHYLQQMGEKIPAMRQFFPFTRIPANLINETLNLTPVGFARYFTAENYFTRLGTLKVEPELLEEMKSNLLARALIGTTSMAAIGIAAWMLKDENGNPLFKVHGAGPTQSTSSGKQLYYQLLDSGWKPHSVEINGHYFPFEFTPIYGALDMIGNFFDTLRYEDMPSPVEAVQQSAFASLHGLMDRGPLKGLSDLLGALTDARKGPQEMQTAADQIFASWKNFVPLAGANLAKQEYQQFLDNRLYQARGPGAFFRDIPFAASAIGDKPLLNFFGEPVRMDPWARVFGTQHSPDPLWDFLDRNDISLTKPSARAEINGKRIKEDQDMFYNYTGFRGAELHRLLSVSLPSLEKIQDETVLDKTIKKLEARADLYAKGQLIQGHTYEVPR